jgi:transcriptional regulator with XRE-family HTH domain
MRLRRHDRHRQPPVLPFAPLAAWQARRTLGLGVDQLAWSLSYHGVRATPHDVEAWEGGHACPDDEQLLALARALWCPVAQLLTRPPDSLREWRLCRDLSRAELARRLRLAEDQVAALERGALSWPADPEQTQRLAAALELTPRELVAATGNGARLEAALRRAVAGRWRSLADEVWTLVPTLTPDIVAFALEALSSQVSTAQLPWGSSNTPATAPSPPPSDPSAGGQEGELTERFWTLTTGAP